MPFDADLVSSKLASWTNVFNAIYDTFGSFVAIVINTRESESAIVFIHLDRRTGFDDFLHSIGITNFEMHELTEMETLYRKMVIRILTVDSYTFIREQWTVSSGGGKPRPLPVLVFTDKEI